MAKRYLAGYITSQLITANTTSAPGIWSLSQSYTEISRSRWPAFVPLPFNLTYLVIAGGGGSGGNSGGGGGAGGVLQGNVTANGGLVFTVVVGSGGSGGSTAGGNSSFSNSASSISVTATGGGRGANRDGDWGSTSGGSGGGGSTGGPSTFGGSAGTPGQGYSGAPGSNPGFIGAGGGGGGAGGAGSPNSGTTGGTGGNGILSTITGAPVGYAGGGTGSGLDYSSFNGISGTVHYSGGIWYGGGGWQTQFTLGQRDGRKNSGGGGGGIGDGTPSAVGLSDSGGGSGGSGIVVLRYPGEQRGYGGNTYSVGGNTVHVFNASGQFFTYLPSSANIINTTNLVLHLDAGDALSFPGPSQTNYGYSYGMPTNTTWYNLVTGGANATLSNIDLGTNQYYGGIYFNGSSYNASVGNLGSGFTNLTVEVWFRSDSVANYRNVLDCNYVASANNVGPRLEYNSSGGLGWVWGSNLNNYQGANLLASGLGTSTPSYAAFTRSGSSYAAYLNGNLTSSGTETYAFTNSISNLVIGQGFSSATERYHQGQIYVVRIYNRALTAGEISTNFSAQRARFGI